MILHRASVLSTREALWLNRLDQIAEMPAEIHLCGHRSAVQVIGHLIPLERDRPDLVGPHPAPDLSFAPSFPVAGNFDGNAANGIFVAWDVGDDANPDGPLLRLVRLRPPSTLTLMPDGLWVMTTQESATFRC